MNVPYAVIFATAVVLANSVRAGILAGPITNAANAHLYYLLSSNTWTASEAEAHTLGGHLVTINDQAENDWVLNTFSPLTGVGYASLWIGLNDSAAEGQFVWASGEAVGFTYWFPGEPNNAGGGEDYATIRDPSEAPPHGSWNDLANNGSPTFGVVEAESAPALTIEVASVAIKWFALTDTVYQLQYRSTLTTNVWVDLGAPVNGTGSNRVIVDPTLDQPRLFYRVRVVQ